MSFEKKFKEFLEKPTLAGKLSDLSLSNVRRVAASNKFFRSYSIYDKQNTDHNTTFSTTIYTDNGRKVVYEHTCPKHCCYGGFINARRWFELETDERIMCIQVPTHELNKDVLELVVKSPALRALLYTTDLRVIKSRGLLFRTDVGDCVMLMCVIRDVRDCCRDPNSFRRGVRVSPFLVYADPSSPQHQTDLSVCDSASFWELIVPFKERTSRFIEWCEEKDINPDDVLMYSDRYHTSFREVGGYLLGSHHLIDKLSVKVPNRYGGRYGESTTGRIHQLMLSTTPANVKYFRLLKNFMEGQ
jgi:hypothetical protein